MGIFPRKMLVGTRPLIFPKLTLMAISKPKKQWRVAIFLQCCHEDALMR